jgi:hypothetical protein
MALLGSPGLGVMPRVPFRVATALGLTLSNPASAFKNGAAATYAAVVAGHKLDLSLNGIQGTVSVIFTGAEAAQAAFLARINAVLNLLGTPLPFGAPAGAVNNAGQIQLIAPFFGTFSGGSVLGSTDADVIASLGQAAGAFTAATGGVQVPGFGAYARQMGGYKVAGASFIQRALPIRSQLNGSLLMLDRGVAATVLADSARFTPAYT